MDLLAKLDNELKDKHLTDFEKVRYIYLRTCELFSFDGRYNFTSLFFDDKLYSDIINRKIDLTNIVDFLVVCHTYSKEVLIKLIKELTNASTVLHTGKHSYVEYRNSTNNIWTLDATYGDFPRAKMGIKTTGFSSEFPNYKEQLEETDAALHFSYKTKLDYLQKISLESSEEIFKSINLLLSSNISQKQYSDAIFFVRYLLLGLNYSFNDIAYVGEEYDIHHIFVPKNDDAIFSLSKGIEDYKLQQISKEEFMKLERTLKR